MKQKTKIKMLSLVLSVIVFTLIRFFSNDDQLYKVTRVVDGDTIEIEGGQKVRYIGVDTPESTTQHECFGREASNENKKLVEGKLVKLVKDVSETDRYGRLLRYVYVDDTFVNDYLVKNGYANAASFPPDVRYQEKFTNSEQEAREKEVGLWTLCDAN